MAVAVQPIIVVPKKIDVRWSVVKYIIIRNDSYGMRIRNDKISVNRT